MEIDPTEHRSRIHGFFVTLGKIIEGNYVMAAFNERFGANASNVAGGSSDQDFHESERMSQNESDGKGRALCIVAEGFISSRGILNTISMCDASLPQS